jgi:hypothetical protein
MALHRQARAWRCGRPEGAREGSRGPAERRPRNRAAVSRTPEGCRKLRRPSGAGQGGRPPFRGRRSAGPRLPSCRPSGALGPADPRFPLKYPEPSLPLRGDDGRTQKRAAHPHEPFPLTGAPLTRYTPLGWQPETRCRKERMHADRPLTKMPAPLVTPPWLPSVRARGSGLAVRPGINEATAEPTLSLPFSPVQLPNCLDADPVPPHGVGFVCCAERRPLDRSGA